MNRKIFHIVCLLCLLNLGLTSARAEELISTSTSEFSASSSPIIIASTTPSKASSSVMLQGKASWYSYKGGMFAASPDFKSGTRLRVYLKSNQQKFIDVTVNDWGPDRARHPDRVIDLDRLAFATLADLGQGIIDVRIEPLVSSSSATLAIASTTILPTTKPVVASDRLGLTSKSAVVINASNGKVLYAKNVEEKLPLASLTKLVAAKVFLDTKPSLNRIVTYKKQDEIYCKKYANLGEMARLRVKDGETMTVRDTLYAALLGSANNSVETLVRASGLKRSTFIYRMNKYAKSVGATKTTFVEPTGLSPDNISTAKDYALISRKVLQVPAIENVTKSKRYVFRTINTKQKHTINNTNKLLASSLNVTGSKTGYLDEAKYCLMTRAKDAKGRQVIAITFGTPVKAASFSETKKLIQFGFSSL